MLDLYVERQAIEQMKAGDPGKFILLFDAYFADLYRYIYRRVVDSAEAERITRLTFLDALGHIQDTPTDVGYLTWLFSLAKPRVWDYIGRSSMPEKRGLIYVNEEVAGQADKEDLVERADKMFGKLSLEEREILRLKFFEEVSDGDVMVVLGMEEGVIGPKIYRVLKRAHFLLFGDSDDNQGVYFGELSGFLARIRDLEKIEVPEVLKLNMKADLMARIDRRDFAIEAEEVEDAPFKPMGEGSNDPAKIFVEAVKEMREEEAARFEKKEKVYDLVDRWKYAIVLVPVLIFVAVVAIVSYELFFSVDLSKKIVRGFGATCNNEVAFGDGYSDRDKRLINKQISDPLCDHFEGADLKVAAQMDEKVNVEVDLPDWMLKYGYVNRSGQWRIQKYEKVTDSNEKSGKILRDKGSA